MEKGSSFVSEETIYDEETILEAISPKRADKSEKKFDWKEVMIGAVPGIILGTFGKIGNSKASVASNETVLDSIPFIDVKNENNETDESATVEAVTSVSEVNTASEVAVIACDIDDDMTFSQAFAEARAEVGPGGVFIWHGNVYSTFIHDEWTSMDNAARQAYSRSVLAACAAKQEESPMIQEAKVDAELDELVDVLAAEYDDNIQNNEILEVCTDYMNDQDIALFPGLNDEMSEFDLGSQNQDYTNIDDIDGLV